MKCICRIGVILCLLQITLLSCATVKNWVGKEDNKPKDIVEPVSIKAPTKEDYLNELQEIIRNEIRQASLADRNKVYRKKPYFWKCYSIYNKEQGPFPIDLQETDSKSKPYVAKVTLEKTIYYTKLHSTRRDAEEDTNYYRSIGEETITYELRNGRWTKIGSTFIPDKTEQKQGNEWVPLKEEIIQQEGGEQKQGWFDRIRSWIF